MPDDDGVLAVGDDVPHVEATLVRPDGTTATEALSSLTDDRPVLLVFYTADFSPDCVTEWCSFRDFEWFGVEGDVEVVGSSRSGPGLHRRFIDYLDLNFSLFSDSDLEMAEKFGVRYRAFGVNARARRSCFLVDSDGVVRYRWLGDHWLDPTRSKPPVDEIYADVAEILDL